MNRNDLIRTINDVLTSYGFIRKGNAWFKNNSKITKIVSIQKSQYGNVFYLNAGYILNDLILDGLELHFRSRSECKILFNLDSVDVEKETIKQEVINSLYVITEDFNKINDSEDILKMLKDRDNLNDIPIVVKKYFNLT